MLWLSKAKDKAKEKYKDAKDAIAEETADSVGKRQKAFKIGGLLGSKVSETASGVKASVAKRAREAHDTAIRLKHSESCMEAEMPEAISAGFPKLFLHVYAATDLESQGVATSKLDAFCKVTVGQEGKPWAYKAARNPVHKLPVCLRDHNPRWNQSCTLPVLPELIEATSKPELTVRIMDAHMSRQDTTVGEARIDLLREPFGSRTMRVIGGNCASITLRWYCEDLCEGASQDQGPPPGFAEAVKQDDWGAWAEAILKYPVDGSSAFWSDYWSRDGAWMQDEGNSAITRVMEAIQAKVPERAGEASGAQVVAESDSAAASQANSKDGGANAAVALESVQIATEPAPEAIQEAPAGGAVKESAPRQDKEESPAVERPVEAMNEFVAQAPFGTIWLGESNTVTDILRCLFQARNVFTPEPRARVIVSVVTFLRGKVLPFLRTRAEELIHGLFTACVGDDVLVLKSLIDTAGTGNHLVSTIAAITRTSLNRGIVGHLVAHSKASTARPVHVLSDIDMTIWVGTFGTGGPKFPSGMIPGAMPLFHSLGGRVTFLSARPPLMEGRTRVALLNDAGVAATTILQGRLAHVAMTLVDSKEAHKGMGEQKWKVFNEFSELYPEATFVFFGDSGEGDVEFASQFMQDDQGKRVPNRHAFIHDVVADNGIDPMTPPSERKALHESGVHVFDTFAGAATRLFEAGVLDSDTLARTTRAMCEDFSTIPRKNYDRPQIFWARHAELMRDFQEASDAMGEPMQFTSEMLAQDNSVEPTVLTSLQSPRSPRATQEGADKTAAAADGPMLDTERADAGHGAAGALGDAERAGAGHGAVAAERGAGEPAEEAGGSVAAQA